MGKLLRSKCCKANVNHVEQVWETYGPVKSNGDFGDHLDTEPDLCGNDNHYRCAECGTEVGVISFKVVG